MVVGAATVLGSFSARLGLDTSGYLDGVKAATGMNVILAATLKELEGGSLAGVDRRTRAIGEQNRALAQELRGLTEPAVDALGKAMGKAAVAAMGMLDAIENARTTTATDDNTRDIEAIATAARTAHAAIQQLTQARAGASEVRADGLQQLLGKAAELQTALAEISGNQRSPTPTQLLSIDTTAISDAKELLGELVVGAWETERALLAAATAADTLTGRAGRLVSAWGELRQAFEREAELESAMSAHGAITGVAAVVKRLEDLTARIEAAQATNLMHSGAGR